VLLSFTAFYVRIIVVSNKLPVSDTLVLKDLLDRYAAKLLYSNERSSTQKGEQHPLDSTPEVLPAKASHQSFFERAKSSGVKHWFGSKTGVGLASV
jgi:hypothetical protein